MSRPLDGRSPALADHLRCLWQVVRHDLGDALRRPLFLGFGVFLAFQGYLVSRGQWMIRSVDSSIGSPASHVNSAYEIAYATALLTFFLFGFLPALAGGMPLLRDARLRVGEILHATPLGPRVYAWGKFLGALLPTLAVAGCYVLGLVVFSELLPDPSIAERYAPFDLASYLLPALLFLAPAAVFTAGFAFFLAAFTRRALLVFVLPVGCFFFFLAFFWGYFPDGASNELIASLNFFDPSGFRWLKWTWLMTDRGIGFYNVQPVGYDAAFVASRAVTVVVGLLLVAAAAERFARGLRRTPKARRKASTASSAPAQSATEPAFDLVRLGMTGPSAAPGVAGILRQVWTVARFELRELRAQPGLYLLVPFVFFFVRNMATQELGPFGTAMLATPGLLAAASLPQVGTWTLLLLLFYGVETYRREEETGLGSICFATRVSTTAVFVGKTLALAALTVAIFAMASLAAVLSALGDGLSPSLGPPAVEWLLLPAPTYLLWVSVALLALHLTRNRFAAYGSALALAAVTAWAFTRGWMNWVSNWPLVRFPTWSDLGAYELHGEGILWNRLLWTSIALLVFALAVAAFVRRERDVTKTLGARMRRQPTARRWLFALLTVVPLALASVLWAKIQNGAEGDRIERLREQYRIRNLSTWIDAPQPEIRHVDIGVQLFPDERALTVRGTYELVNLHREPLPWFAVTGGFFWSDVVWTWNGAPIRPENRDGLWVFDTDDLGGVLPPAGGGTLGFAYRSVVRPGPNRDGMPGGETTEFVLPSATVLTSRNPDFLPVIGWMPTIGVDVDEAPEPGAAPPGAHLGPLESQPDPSSFTARVGVLAPKGFRVHSMGVLSESGPISGDLERYVWTTDYPVRVLNLIAGRWQGASRTVDAAQGPVDVEVWHAPAHDVNVQTMLDALAGSIEHFGNWFKPYPWRALRLSEFPAHAVYARGNPTNILFSEATGFLAEPGSELDLPFLITAHEAAHQWWGHLVAPGDAPGGIVLAEGAAHFSTLMLLETLRGDAMRQAMARRIEARFGEARIPHREKPLAKTTWHRTEDGSVIYDKGGWALWMLRRHMGHDAFVAGVQEYFRVYHEPPGPPVLDEDGLPVFFDHPVIEDFLAVLRPHASDPAAFDRFADQWFFDTALPEYRVRNAAATADGAGWRVTATVENVGGTAMPVEVAAVSVDGQTVRRTTVTVVLGPGAEVPVDLHCDFEPQRLVVDPDVQVLQLQRRAAAAKL